MPEPIQAPTTPVISPANFRGSPITTAASILLAAGQYLYFNGDKMPTDAAGWASLAVGLLLAVGGSLLRGPAPQATMPGR